MRQRLTSLLLAALLLISLCACGQKADPWQEQYDLGVRYLSDGNYEEAVIAFTAAIEIDPKKAEAYLSLANVYIEMDDFDAALEILQRGYDQTGDQSLQDKIDEINSGNVKDFLGRNKKMTGYDSGGNVSFWHIYSYDDSGNNFTVTSYDKDGNKTGAAEQKEDAEGRQIASYSYRTETGEVGQIYYEYDSKGNRTKEAHYDLNGQISRINENEYDASDQIVRQNTYMGGELASYETYSYEDGIKHRYCYYKQWGNGGDSGDFTLSSHVVYPGDGEYWYDAQGTLQGYTIWVKDDTGKTIGSDHYDANGVLQSSTRYD